MGCMWGLQLPSLPRGCFLSLHSAHQLAAVDSSRRLPALVPFLCWCGRKGYVGSWISSLMRVRLYLNFSSDPKN